MKFVLPVFILLVISCGKTEVDDDQRLNTTNSLEAVKLSSSELKNLREICGAIATKTTTIGALVNTSWVFSGTEKSCTDTVFKETPDSTVSLLSLNGSYSFGTPASLFYFSDVETSNEGVLGRICSRISTELTSPLDPAAVDLLYFTTEKLSASDCPNATEERCIKIERATTVNTEKGTKGKVHSREWIRIRVNEPRLGFFTYKKRISIAGCDENLFFGRTATLK